jgi:hypothetical protein
MILQPMDERLLLVVNPPRGSEVLLYLEVWPVSFELSRNHLYSYVASVLVKICCSCCSLSLICDVYCRRWVGIAVVVVVSEAGKCQALSVIAGADAFAVPVAAAFERRAAVVDAMLF